MQSILLIDDDLKLGKLLVDYFKQYDLQLKTADRPSIGLDLLRDKSIQLLVLDVMLPEKDGFEVCREIRANPDKYGQLPIIMLTARGDVTDRIVGLELGADDYLPKPFEPRELVARIHNVLRRQPEIAPDNQLLTSHNLSIDLINRNAKMNQENLPLTTMEYELLCLFMQAPGKTFSRDDLMNKLRGIDAELYSRAVDTLVSRLRQKLGDTSKQPHFIKTVWGRGYTFTGDVRTEEHSS